MDSNGTRKALDQDLEGTEAQTQTSPQARSQDAVSCWGGARQAASVVSALV